MNKGFAPIIVLIIVAVVIGVGGYFVVQRFQTPFVSDVQEFVDDTTEDVALLDNKGPDLTGTDADDDGLIFEDERKYCTDPNNPDTDGDGFIDGDEVKNGYNPNGEGTLDEYLASGINCESVDKEEPVLLTEESAQPATNKTVGWKTYYDTALGIEVKYPPDWIPSKTKSDDGWTMQLADDNSKHVNIISSGYSVADFTGPEFTQFSISYIEEMKDFNKPSYTQKELPNGMLAYYALGRRDEWGDENMYYVQNGPNLYLLSFFFQNNEGGRDGLTQEELELENKILSTFKFVDPNTIKQSRLNKDIVRSNAIPVIFLSLLGHFQAQGGFPYLISDIIENSPESSEELIKALIPPPPNGACTPEINEYIYEPIGTPTKIKNNLVYPNFKFTYCLEDTHGPDEDSAGVHVYVFDSSLTK